MVQKGNWRLIMKIYKAISIDINGNVISEDSYEYHGIIAECKGGSSPPPPTEAEEALTEAQTELINQQISQLEHQNELIDEMWPNIEQYIQGQLDYQQLMLESQQHLLPLQTALAEQGIELNSLQMEAIQDQLETSEAIRPALLEAMGYELDEGTGQYVAIEGEQDPLLAQLEERYTAALRGETEISPYLEKQLQDERAKLEEDLSRRLGPNWQTTTPGRQALSDFQTRADLLREEARQSTISSAGSQYLATRGLLAGERQQTISNLASLMGGGTSVPTSIPTGIGGGGGDLSGLLSGMSGGGAGNVSQNIANLRDYYQGQRYDPWLMQQGQQAGQMQAMFGGLMGGAQVGANFGVPGAAIGGGAGLLAGYLLS